MNNNNNNNNNILCQLHRGLGLHGWHVGPIETGSRQEHVAYECFYRRFAYESNEEELLNDLTGNGP